MIRRITRNNDYKDIIKSCPAGVIDYVYRVDYYVSGHPEVFVEMTPVKVGEHLEVVISTEALENLTYNGVLMRRAYYSQADSEYPDDSYDLEFVDNMNVWLGEEDTAAPFDPGYLTEDDLKTINGESIVGEGNLEIEAVIPDYYATKSWVSDQGYLKSVPSGYATKSWVSSNFLSTTALTGYATESWVSAQGYLTSETIPSDIATQSWVESQGYITSAALNGYATESWVSSNFLSTTALTGYATESWVLSQSYITSAALNGYATESWVLSQSYITSAALNGYATESWVSSNFLSSTALTGYATESWVQSQGYLTSVPSEYATQSWVESQGFAHISDLSSVVEYDSEIALGNSEYIGYVDVLKRPIDEETFETRTLILGYAPTGETTWDVVEARGSQIGENSYELVSDELIETGFVHYATESWVGDQGYLTEVPSEYATESWVSSNFLSTTALSGYATESWVQSQGYLTSVPSEYATQSWVSSQFFETSKIWTGTSSQWAQLTSEQQAFYTIALVTE